MGIIIWLGYIVLGIILVFLLYFIEKKYHLNKFQSICFSIIYMMILAGLGARFGFSRFNENIFLVFVFELVFKMIYYTYFLEKDFFDKREGNVSYSIILIVLSYIINTQFINKVDQVFLSGEDFRIILWFMAFLFLYQFFKNKDDYLQGNKEIVLPEKEKIVMMYAKLKNQYLEDTRDYDKDLSYILYSIMIFNNYLRPEAYRTFDNLIFKINGKANNLGIMQVKSKKFITDTESIDLAYKKLVKLRDKQSTKKINIDNIIDNYDKDNSKNIKLIYDYISKI